MTHGIRVGGVELVHDDFLSRVGTNLAARVGEPDAGTGRVIDDPR